MFVIVGLWAEKTQLATARQHGIVVRKARQSQTTTGLGLERCLERCNSNVMPACLRGLGGGETNAIHNQSRILADTITLVFSCRQTTFICSHQVRMSVCGRVSFAHHGKINQSHGKFNQRRGKFSQSHGKVNQSHGKFNPPPSHRLHFESPEAWSTRDS